MIDLHSWRTNDESNPFWKSCNPVEVRFADGITQVLHSPASSRRQMGMVVQWRIFKPEMKEAKVGPRTFSAPLTTIEFTVVKDGKAGPEKRTGTFVIAMTADDPAAPTKIEQTVKRRYNGWTIEGWTALSTTDNGQTR